jgi:hypothetical protein
VVTVTVSDASEEMLANVTLTGHGEPDGTVTVTFSAPPLATTPEFGSTSAAGGSLEAVHVKLPLDDAWLIRVTWQVVGLPVPLWQLDRTFRLDVTAPAPPAPGAECGEAGEFDEAIAAWQAASVRTMPMPAARDHPNFAPGCRFRT